MIWRKEVAGGGGGAWDGAGKQSERGGGLGAGRAVERVGALGERRGTVLGAIAAAGCAGDWEVAGTSGVGGPVYGGGWPAHDAGHPSGAWVGGWDAERVSGGETGCVWGSGGLRAGGCGGGAGVREAPVGVLGATEQRADADLVNDE